MNTAELSKYAPQAREDFMAAMRLQAGRIGVRADGCSPVESQGEAIVIDGVTHPKSIQTARQNLVQRVESLGFDATMDAAAYTWFNRLCAIRYMELHGFLDHGYRVLSHPDGGTLPEVLEKATDIDLPGLDKSRVAELKLDGTQDEELYRLLLKAQCNALHHSMPFLFEKVGAGDELLLPEGLLHSDSLILGLIEGISEESWQDIEIIGWLYQFYISEKKDDVIGKVVKSEDIPAATQLFTPNWIVKYMVQNSLGAQWLATYPQSPLKEQMEYYIEPAEQTEEVKAQLAAITPSQLNPEELTLIDPASGSGHILVEAYELFKAIYLERGYRQRDVPQLILTQNLFGLDIDERAAQLTGFALMMKGRADDRRLFERGVKLNVMALVDSAGFDSEGLAKGVEIADYDLRPGDLTELKNLFEHATTFGSLIQVPEGLAGKLPALKQLSEAASQDLFVSEALKRLGPLVQQAELLAAQYDTVVVNPPYMGGQGMNALVKKFAKDNYPSSKSDLFACFIERCDTLGKTAGRVGVVAPYVWMFISSYERLRKRVLDETSLTSLIQLEYNAFEPACIPVATFTFMRHHLRNLIGSYIKLSEFKGHQNQAPRTLEAINNPNCGWLHRSKPDDFKKIPGRPISYWVGDGIYELFDHAPKIQTLGSAKTGMTTGNIDHFTRHWYEVDKHRVLLSAKDAVSAAESGKKWFPYNKGGRFRKWYGNNTFIVNWEDNGRELRDFKGSTVRSPEFYLKPNISWSEVSSSKFSSRVNGAGFVFDTSGPALFVSEERQHQVQAYLSSKLVNYLLRIINPTLHFLSGNIENLPIPTEVVSSSQLQELGLLAYKISRYDWDSHEHSWGFQSNPLIACKGPTLEQGFREHINKCSESVSKLQQHEKSINTVCHQLADVSTELTPDVPSEQITLTVNPAYRYGGKLTEEEQWTRFRQDTMEELVSYAIGCMMGRYSLDAPGLIYAHSGNEGFDALLDQGQYTSFPADDDGIVPLTDTEWFEDDACNRLIEFVSKAWEESHLEANLTFLAENLSPKKNESSRETIRRYINDKFFKDHVQRYKKRPIYWLFTSGKQKAFQCLVYLHRYNESTLARMRTQYVIPLLGKMSHRIEILEGDRDAADSPAHRKRVEKELTKLEKQQAELQSFDENLRHYADQKITLDLDDGVKVNYGRFGDLLAEVKAVHGKKVVT